MHYKFLLIIIIALIGAFFYLHNINPTEVDFTLYEEYKYTVPVTYLVIGGFFIGLLLSVINSVFSDMRRAVKDMRIRRERKAQEAMESNYRSGIAALSRRNPAKARTYFTRAVEANPEGLDIYLHFADAYMAQESYADALTVLEKGFIKNPESLEILAKIAEIAQESEDRLKVERAYGDMIKIDPGNPLALKGMRELKLKAGDWMGAVEFQKRLIASMKGKADKAEVVSEDARLMGYLYEEALKEAEASSFDSALAIVKEILKHEGSFVPAHMLQGEILLRQGNYQSAARLWERGYEKTIDPLFLLKLEDLHLERSEPERALALYRAAVEGSPQDINLKIFLGRLYLRLEMVDEAIEELERIQNDIEDSYYLEILLSEAYLRRSQGDNAARHFKQALGLADAPSPSYLCSACGEGALNWVSRCPACEEWNTFKVSRSTAVTRTTPSQRIANLRVIK